MKLGATDYLLKPIDRTVLARALEGILQRRRLREEHARLHGREPRVHGRVLALRARARALLDALASSRSPTASSRGSASRRTRTAACSGSRATTRPSACTSPACAASCGSTRSPRSSRSPRCRASSRRSPSRSATRSSRPRTASAESRTRTPRARGAALWVALRRGAQLARRWCGSPTGSTARRSATCSARPPRSSRVFAAQALDNAHALRARSSAARSAIPVTKAYTRAYFDDVVHNEIRKAAPLRAHASRWCALELDGLADLRARVSRVGVRGVGRVARVPRRPRAPRAPTCSPPSPRAASACCSRRPTRSAPPC